ncbi:T9SS type A sorting domain-containing protein [Microvirga sp. STR05]|uniref:T9SS type A sorting domain-containing protein n=1 Tax=Hymenobacter duratus TaxID=2771356 RepID=A0ABR8JE01_9BACT|nr:T9SS type A sorting domain-containing protein [Hymenobacter duratus]MBD2714267.1 T9SS type A sorting domain-containing protein [Hymenobacter duratus]MBR7949170.1 T9SS type A sorting domain-containing protein [Microvirga sp. STR05]
MLNLLLLASAALAQTVTISSAQDIGGIYTTLTIARGGIATMRANVAVTGLLRVEDGGTLITNEWLVGGGAFELQAGGTLWIGDAFGIMAAGSTSPNGGSIRSFSRSYSPDANYVYNAAIRFQAVPVVQYTGSGLPARVRSLIANVVNIQGTPGNNILALQSDVSVAEVLGTTNSTIIDPNFLLSPGPARTITLLSDPMRGTALLVDRSGNGVPPGPLITRPIIIQRSIDPGLNAGPGYRHLSAPVQGASVSMLAAAGFTPVVNPSYNGAAAPGRVSPFPTVFGYDQTRLASSPAVGLSPFDKGWVSPVSLSDPLAVGWGYTVNLPASSVINFQGVPNQRDATLTLNRGAEADAGWQLLGNPFPAPLDWRQVPMPAGLDAALYVYQSTGQYGGRYRSYVNGIGNPVLPLGQGFFVRVSQPNSVVSLTLPAAARVTTFGQEPSVQRGAETRPLLQLTLARAGSSLTDETYVYFEAGATAGVDTRFDALKMQHSPAAAPTLWTLMAGTEQAINGLPRLTGSAVVPLGMALPQAGTYTLEAAQLLNLSTAIVYLHDDLTGQDVNLSQQPRYTFTAGAAGLLTSRFELRFEPLRPTASAVALSAASVQLYPNPAHTRFSLLLPAVPGAKQVQATLRNTLGQAVRRQTALLPAAGTRLEFDVRDLRAGVYVLCLQAGGETLVKRVVVE